MNWKTISLDEFPSEVSMATLPKDAYAVIFRGDCDPADFERAVLYWDSPPMPVVLIPSEWGVSVVDDAVLDRLAWQAWKADQAVRGEHIDRTAIWEEVPSVDQERMRAIVRAVLTGAWSEPS